MPGRNDLLGRVDRWIFAVEDARRLAAVRIGLCGLLALRLATSDYRGAAGQPAALFRPASYMRLFDRMPSPAVATGLQVCGVVAALLAAAGLVVRASLPLALACSLILDGVVNSLGRVIVGDAMLTLCLLLVLASGSAAGEAWTLRGPLHRMQAWPGGASSPQAVAGGERVLPAVRYGWPVRTAMLTVVLGLFFAGFQKLRYSGLAWVTSDNMRWILYAASDSRSHPSPLALMIADRPWLAHLCAGGALTVELAFPLALFRPRSRWVLLVAVVAMHGAIQLAIGLDYSAQWLTMLVVFVDWPAAAVRLGARRQGGPVNGLRSRLQTIGPAREP